MAKQTQESEALFNKIMEEIKGGDIRPFYLLFGKEHFYIDKICSLLMEKVPEPHERDFAQIVYYGLDVTAEMVVSTARQFPMMAARQLVVVKEAQLMKNVEKIASYFEHMVPSTVLVICYKTPTDPSVSKDIDKRTKFYKDAGKVGVVFEAIPVADYKMPLWIEHYAKSIGLSISPAAAAMLAECCGTEITKVALEIDKLRTMTGENVITEKMIEENVGLRRDYSAFELTKALSIKDSLKAYKIVSFFAESQKRFPIQKTMGALSSHFLKILKFHAYAAARYDRTEICSRLGINPYFYKEYEMAARLYPMNKTMRIMGLLKEYDYRSKSNMRGVSDDGALLTELISKILN